VTSRIRPRTAGAPVAVAAAALAVALAGAVPAAAQDAGDVASALCHVQVGYEDEAIETGFLTDADLVALEDVVDGLQSSDAWFRVVVLGSPVDADSTQSFADDLMDELDGGGRVVVFDPEDVGVASSLDGDDEVRAAADAAFEVAGDERSLAAGVTAAAAELGAAGGAGGTSAQPDRCGSTGASDGTGDDGASGDDGGGSWLPWLIALALAGGAIALVVVLVRRRRRQAEAVPLGEAEAKVRAAVDEASSLIVDLANQVDLPSTPEPARTAFTEGGAAFAELGDELEDADTREELEAVWPRLQDALWRLRTAKALADGTPPPPPPPPAPLFPPELLAPPGGAPGAPGSLAPPAPIPAPPQYRRRSSNPFLTGAAMTALSVLLQRGLGSGRSHRPSWDGDIFGGLGGLGRSGSGSSSSGRSRSSGRRSGGISYGSRRSGGGGVRRSGSLGRRRR
jgi:uncharacterized membrane protein YgcG